MEPSYVPVPSFIAWMIGVVFIAFVGWVIRDRERVAETLTKIRVRLGNIETILNRHINGDDDE